MSSNASDTESATDNAGNLILSSGSVNNWDDDWEGDLTEEEAERMGMQVELVTRWWGFELHCNELAARAIDRIRRMIFNRLRLALPPLVSQLVAIYLRVRSRIISRMLRGNGIRFISPWTAPLLLTPRPLPGPDAPELPIVDDQKMRWTVFDASHMNWSDPELFPAHRSAASPALAEYEGKLYCVYRGADTDTSLYWTSYSPEDGTPENGWTEAVRLPAAYRSVTGPALVEYRGELHCFFLRDVGSGRRELVGGRFSGGTWHPTHFTFGEMVITDSSPSLVVAHDILFCFFQNFFEGSHQLQYIRLQGTNFLGRQRTPILNAASAPAAVFFQNRIVCVWASQDRSSIFGTAFNPQNHGVLSNEGVRFDNQFTSVKPALAVYENRLHCVHRGLHDQRLWWGTIVLGGSPLMPRPNPPVAFSSVHESFVEPGLITYQDDNMNGYGNAQLLAVYRGPRQ